MDIKKYSPYFSPFASDIPAGLTFIPVTNDSLQEFQRLGGGTPMDCVINAMQLLNLINNKEGHLLRVTQNATEFGFNPDQIALLFKTCFYYDSNEKLLKDFNFKQFSPNDFGNNIDTCPPGQGILCGIRTPRLGHVFLVARTLNGVLLILDPQIAGQDICDQGWNCINRYMEKAEGGLYDSSQAQLFILENGQTYPA